MSKTTSLVWFRLDLRLADNPALAAAIKRGGRIVPVFIFAPLEENPFGPGGASRWWLHQSLAALDESLRQLDSRLIIRQGPTIQALDELIKETSAEAVFWNRRYEPAVIARDSRIREYLASREVFVESFNGNLLNEPWTIKNQSNKPFQVFSPFWRTCLRRPLPDPVAEKPRKLRSPARWPKSVSLNDLELESKIDWTKGIRASWSPGETGAHHQLGQFIGHGLADYSMERNRPDHCGTSRLSPHLHFGEITPRQIVQAVLVHAKARRIPAATWHKWQFLNEIGWREFSHHLLYHFPHTAEEPLRPEFKKFPWRKDAANLKAWQQGLTGYPVVDAGMRELWATGWMHNRVRMIVASFLVKDLLIRWQDGAAWFWDTLVDADLAQNSLGWQWTAGCGADAAPYFRVFNPITQGEKFDPEGSYVRAWVPELSKIPAKWIHQPSTAPGEILANAGVDLGKTYPNPIVNHTIAREVALEAFEKIKARKSATRGGTHH